MNIDNFKKDYSLIEDVRAGIDSINRVIALADDTPSVEGYNILISPFTEIINIVHSIVKNLTARILKIGKTVKRSELRVYHDRNPMDCLKAFGSNYLDILDTQISTPNNMKSKYVVTATNIKNFYDSIGTPMLQGFYDNMNALYKHISMNNSTSNTNVSIGTFAVTEADKLREQMYVTHVGDFSKSVRDITVAFKEKFSSMQEFKDTDSILLSLEPVITKIGVVVEIVEDTSKVTDKVVYYLKNSDNLPSLINKQFVSTLATYTRNMAEAYDMYASVMDVFIAVEHNFVRVIDKVYAVS